MNRRHEKVFIKEKDSSEILLETAAHLTKLANNLLREDRNIVHEDIWVELNSIPAMLITLSNKLIMRVNKSKLDERHIRKGLALNKLKNTTTENSDANESLPEFLQRIENLISCGEISINEAREMFNKKYPETLLK